MAIVFKAFRRCLKELGSKNHKVTKKMQGWVRVTLGGAAKPRQAGKPQRNSGPGCGQDIVWLQLPVPTRKALHRSALENGSVSEQQAIPN